MTTLYLRNQENLTLVDIELYTGYSDGNYVVTDLHSIVVLLAYSAFLLKYHPHGTMSIVMCFHALSELRGWFYEMNRKNKSVRDTINVIKIMFEDLVNDYDLKWVED